MNGEPPVFLHFRTKMSAHFVIPVKRFVHGRNIVAQVPGKIVSKDGLIAKVKMYDLEKPLSFPVDVFTQMFRPYEASAELVADFDAASISEGDLREAGGHMTEAAEKTMWAMFGKCSMDAYMSCGNAKSCPIEKYKTIVQAAAGGGGGNASTTLESYKPQFNRRARNSAIIGADFDEAAFQKDPLPVGIDSHEFATKTEQTAILRTLVTQLYGFEGAPPMSDDMQTLLGLTEKPVAGTHTCKYCCKPMELEKVAQEYKAKVHYLNLCHDDPKRGTRADNLYWGHTTCNREQGGCSTFERVVQGLQLGARTTFTAEERAALAPLLAALKASLDAANA